MPPRLELAAGPRFGQNTRVATVDASAGVWFDVSLGGYGSARRAYANAVVTEASRRRLATLQQVKSEAGLAWVDSLLAREIERVRRQSLARAERMERLANDIVLGGKANPSSVALARVALGRARTGVLDAEGQRFIADSRLRFWVGLDPDVEIAIVDGPPQWDFADSPAERDRMLSVVRAEQPEVLLATAVAERAERAAELAEAEGVHSLALGPSATREGPGDWLLLARVEVPLPLVNPAALRRAEARQFAQVSRAQARELASAKQLELRLAWEEREHARRLLATLERELLAPAADALEQAELRYEAGASELAVVLQAERELLAAEESRAEAVADVLRGDLEWMRLLPARYWPTGSGR
jgi:outer membrane protein TolC